MYTYTYTCIHVHTCIRVFTYIHLYTHIHVHTYIHVYAHTYIHVHTHTQTHAHTLCEQHLVDPAELERKRDVLKPSWQRVLVRGLKALPQSDGTPLAADALASDALEVTREREREPA